MISSNLFANCSLQYPYVASTDGCMVRYNGYTSKLEAYNNSHNRWSDITPTIQFELSYDIKTILSWANDKMIKEQEYQKLATQYTSVKDALDNLTKAQERLDIISALVKTESKNAS